jgi:Domain of unknown function (DUF397)
MSSEGSQPAWRRSMHCESSACVEITSVDDHVLMRDAKDPDGPTLTFPRAAWAEFLHAIRKNEIDHRRSE